MDQPPPDFDEAPGVSGVWYLATPYSRYPAGVDAAHTEACRIAAALFRAGLLVYSPIAHTHAIAQIGGLDLGFDQWAAFDEAMIAASVGMIVVTMDGWQQSAGIAAEIAICNRLGKPVEYIGTSLNVRNSYSALGRYMRTHGSSSSGGCS